MDITGLVTHSQSHVKLCRLYLGCLWIDLDIPSGFDNKNLIRKPYLMVREVKMADIIGGCI